MRLSEVYCRALVRSVSQCSLQAVWKLVRESGQWEVYGEGVKNKIPDIAKV